MADSTIFDLTSETALTAAHEFVTQDTSAATRAKAATFALMGGLEHNAQTITTTDVTGAVGQLYYCTIAGLTANRNLTLPTAQVGERIGVYIVDGDASFELILKGAATVTINGGSAATEWSRLFIADECVIFRATSSTNWIVEADGRIPQFGVMYLAAATTGTPVAHATWTQIPMDTAPASEQVGDIDDIANERFTPRRAGLYRLQAQYNFLTSLADQQLHQCAIYDDDSTPARLFKGARNYTGKAGPLENLVIAELALASADVGTGAGYFSGYVFQSGTSVAADLDGNADRRTSLTIREIL